MKVLVVTCAHRGDDARIVHRQVRALSSAGHQVVLVAPDPGEMSRQHDPPSLRRIPIRRAVGRRRARGWVDAWRALATESASSDVVIVHDPELIPVCLAVRSTKGKRIWDVHEDFVAVAHEVAWCPRAMRRLLVAGVAAMLAIARRNFSIIVAEPSYLSSFPTGQVVPNHAAVVLAATARRKRDHVVYVGRISFDRGLREMIEIGRRLRAQGGPRLVLVGAPDPDCSASLQRAVESGDVEWRGVLPNPEALTVMAESLVGLCLLQNTPNYLASYPTKIGEYFAVGSPVIATPLPQALAVIEKSGGGVVTQSWSGQPLVQEVIEFVMLCFSDANHCDELGRKAREFALAELDWGKTSADFVFFVERVANSGSGRR